MSPSLIISNNHKTLYNLEGGGEEYASRAKNQFHALQKFHNASSIYM